MGGGLNEHTASSSQEWHPDVNRDAGTGRPVAETTKKLIGTKIISPQLGDIQDNVGHLIVLAARREGIAWVRSEGVSEIAQRQKIDKNVKMEARVCWI